MGGVADVVDRVSMSFEWSLTESKLLKLIDLKNYPSEVKNLRDREGKCLPPVLKGTYELATVLEVVNGLGGALDVKIERSYPAVDVAQFCTASRKSVAAEKKINVQIKGEALTILADEQLLRQTLFNLLLNSVQVANEGGAIEVESEQRGSEAQIEIRDNGPGVPVERRSEIFKPYFTTQKTGTGLGLAVVQQIVLAHGWEIECVGNEPKGAVFRIKHIKLAA
jgi:signal transduction histidine kinase